MILPFSSVKINLHNETHRKLFFLQITFIQATFVPEYTVRPLPLVPFPVQVFLFL